MGGIRFELVRRRGLVEPHSFVQPATSAEATGRVISANRFANERHVTSPDGVTLYGRVTR